MTTTRSQLGKWFRDKLGDTVTVYDYPTTVDDPADRITAVIVIVRQRVEPSTTLGVYLETHQVWVLDPHTDREVSEDALDRSLDRVLAAIHGEPWAKFVDAERDTFADEYPAYRVTVTIPSTHTTDEETPS